MKRRKCPECNQLKPPDREYWMIVKYDGYPKRKMCNECAVKAFRKGAVIVSA